MTDRKIDVEVIITRMSDSTTKVMPDETLFLDNDGDPITFIWDEGNYACDCNRELFFSGDSDGLECSRGRFRVAIRRKSDGAIVYSEDA